MAHSSYDHLFAKPAMRWLLTDYVSPGARAWLHFRPAEDPRISVSADLSGSAEHPGKNSTGGRACPPECCRPLRTYRRVHAAAARHAQYPDAVQASHAADSLLPVTVPYAGWISAGMN